MASISSKKSLFLKEPFLTELQKDRNFSYKDIWNIFNYSIVEVVFFRRLKHDGTRGHKTNVRRMLATANWELVNRYKCITEFVPPKTKKHPSYYKEHQMLIVWDMLKLKWRIVPVRPGEYIILSAYIMKENNELWSKFVKDWYWRRKAMTDSTIDKFSDS